MGHPGDRGCVRREGVLRGSALAEGDGLVTDLDDASGGEARKVRGDRLVVGAVGRGAEFEFAAAHREFFDRHDPCLTMVEVSRLIDPAMLVEIEAEGVASAD